MSDAVVLHTSHQELQRAGRVRPEPACAPRAVKRAESEAESEAEVSERQSRELPVPSERTLAMIEACTANLREAAELPDVLQVIAEADAINVFMRMFNASKELQKRALTLRVEAEVRLGQLSKSLPRLPRHLRGSGVKTKTELLKEAGIKFTRANTAEKLASLPSETVKEAIEQNTSLHAVTKGLGITAVYRGEAQEKKKVRDFAFLAEEAILLLERAVKDPVYQGSVKEFRNRFEKLRRGE